MSDQPYIVSARKYRPANFHSVVGQKALTNTLKNAVTTGRVAQAYLFCGPRGVGKTSCARIFAKTLNCQNRTPEGEACGVCDACKSVDLGNSFNLLELDAASNNSVNDIRDIMDQVNIPPQNALYRVFIIDEVHMLSSQAFNAFLKTLEEPPKNVVFILATTEKHKILPTILSRCQVYDFKRITIDDMVEHLQYVAQQENITADEQALGVIAQKADGAMRDALSIFDQVAASCMGNITYDDTIANLNVLDHQTYFRLVEAFIQGDIPQALIIYNEVRDKGFDSLFFLTGLASHLRNLMVAADPRTIGLLEVSKSVASQYVQQAASLPVHWYYHALSILNDCEVHYRTAANKQLVVELALVKVSALRNAEVKEAAAPRPATPMPAAKPVSPTQPQSQQPTPLSSARPTTSPQPSLTPRPSIKPRITPRISTPRISSPSSSGDKNSEARTPADSDELHPAAGPTPLNISSDNPVSEEKLNDAWQQFIVSHPAQKIVVATMQTSFPHPIEGTQYQIEVANAGQKAQFDVIMPELIAFLRDKVGNHTLSLRVVVQDISGSNRRLTQREFLTKAVTENKNLSNLLNFLDATLS